MSHFSLVLCIISYSDANYLEDRSSCKHKVEDLRCDGDGQNVPKQDFEQSKDDLDAFEAARERVSSIIIHKFGQKS